MRRRRTPTALVVGVLAVAGLTGCAGAWPFESRTCVDWVSFESPTDALEDADAVVSGRIVGEAGDTRMFGERAAIWTVAVDEWLAGDGPDELDVVSVPATCGATTPDDPFAAMQDEDRVVVFLQDDPDVGWRSITPWQGVVPAGPDGGVPEVWPADATSTGE